MKSRRRVNSAVGRFLNRLNLARFDSQHEIPSCGARHFFNGGIVRVTVGVGERSHGQFARLLSGTLLVVRRRTTCSMARYDCCAMARVSSRG
jgi:hypothetical protein